MSFRPALFASLAWLAGGASLSAATSYVGSTALPPTVPREFRGAWVATVGNIDWPSKAGLTTAEQKTELLALLDRAAALRLNAIVLQVRPSCDALYASRLEPWSEYLTGTMGRAPQPYYDPLAYAVEEAHRRGLELHAWFNPYRARHTSARSPAAATHLSKTRPDLVRTYGKHLWLAPAERHVQAHAISVILEVLRRYDVDGIHLDDYFYPYPEKNAAGKTIEFPDGKPWQAYVKGGGKLARDDWRREQVNRFLQRLYEVVKAEKPWVKLGVSPFGIWRPGNPPSVKGLDAYETLYADSRRWLASGWLDYCAPQLYWPIDAKEQSFPELLKWWAGQNPQRRHLWPGLSASPVGGATRPAREVLGQLKLTRTQAGVGGSLLWSFKPLLQNRDGLADALRADLFSQPALVPASPWLGGPPPGRAQLALGTDPASGAAVLHWQPAAKSDQIRWWLVQAQTGGRWAAQLHPGHQRTMTLAGAAAEIIAITAMDRSGQASPPAVVEKAATGAKP